MLDMLIKGAILALTPRHVMNPVTQYTHLAVKVAVQLKVKFLHPPYLHSQVCKTTFQFLHGIGKKRLSAIKVHFKQFGIDTRPHGNCHRQPINALSPADVERVTNFVMSHAEDHAILLPGRIPGYNRFDIKLLPSSTTKLSIWESYKLTVDQVGHRVVGYKSFHNIWNKYLPFIIVTKPMSDLCWTCQKKQHNDPEEQQQNRV